MSLAREANEIIRTLEARRCYAQCPCCEEPILLKDASLFYLDDFSPDADKLYQQLLQDLKERKKGLRARREAISQTSEVGAKAVNIGFILERIAEDQQFEASPEDYQAEIALIAAQSGESVRRVRARLEKGDMMDALRNQIVERKVIDLVLSHAKFKDVPYKPESTETEAIDQSAGGEEEESEIPEAKHSGEAEPLRTSKEHD